MDMKPDVGNLNPVVVIQRVRALDEAAAALKPINNGVTGTTGKFGYYFRLFLKRYQKVVSALKNEFNAGRNYSCEGEPNKVKVEDEQPLDSGSKLDFDNDQPLFVVKEEPPSTSEDEDECPDNFWRFVKIEPEEAENEDQGNWDDSDSSDWKPSQSLNSLNKRSKRKKNFCN